MDKLRETVKKYAQWSELTIYIDRMEAHLESDFSHSLENAKALLETIEPLAKLQKIKTAKVIPLVLEAIF